MLATATRPLFQFDNTYARELSGLYKPWKPAEARAPQLLFFNRPLAEEMGLDAAALSGDAGAAIFAGNTVPEGAEPIAQAYAGHQFGGFSPQLGDGRALLLGEVLDAQGRRRPGQSALHPRAPRCPRRGPRLHRPRAPQRPGPTLRQANG